MQRKKAFIFIIALLCTMTSISVYEFFRVNNEQFILDVTYNWHRYGGPNGISVNEYHTITIQTSLLVRAYTILSRYRVDGHPLWLNVSDWSQDQYVTFADSIYQVTPVSQNWKAHQYGIDLYYDGESGFLVRALSGKNGYTTDVTLAANNLDDLFSCISGRYLIYDNLLIIGIFAELGIIIRLVTRRKNSKRPSSVSSSAYVPLKRLSRIINPLYPCFEKTS